MFHGYVHDILSGMNARKLCKCGNPRRPEQGDCQSCHAASMRKFRSENRMTPEQKRKANCRSYLTTYIRRGCVTRGPCAICGRLDTVEGHHEDYARPLWVVWLCRGHHLQVTKGWRECPPPVDLRLAGMKRVPGIPLGVEVGQAVLTLENRPLDGLFPATGAGVVGV